MLNKHLKRPVIPMIVIEDTNDAEPLAEALLKSDMDVIEITYRTAAAPEAAVGVNMLENLAAPYASFGVKFCPTGGVSLNNMVDYLSLPMVSAIGGSRLATWKQIAARQWDVHHESSQRGLLHHKKIPSPFSQIIWRILK